MNFLPITWVRHKAVMGKVPEQLQNRLGIANCQKDIHKPTGI